MAQNVDKLVKKLRGCFNTDSDVKELAIALDYYHQNYNRMWKSELINAWYHGDYLAHKHERILQRARNCDAYDIIVKMTASDVKALANKFNND